MTIARELGVSESGLNRWLQKKSGGIRPIRVVEQAAAAAELVSVTPGGYRLEGLDAASAADLLRRLGCWDVGMLIGSSRRLKVYAFALR